MADIDDLFKVVADLGKVLDRKRDTKEKARWLGRLYALHRRFVGGD